MVDQSTDRDTLININTDHTLRSPNTFLSSSHVTSGSTLSSGERNKSSFARTSFAREMKPPYIGNKRENGEIRSSRPLFRFGRRPGLLVALPTALIIWTTNGSTRGQSTRATLSTPIDARNHSAETKPNIVPVPGCALTWVRATHYDPRKGVGGL